MKNSDLKNNTAEKEKLRARFRLSSFPPAAVLGALSSFAADAFGSAPKPREEDTGGASLVQINLSESQPGPKQASSRLPLEYSQVLVLGAASSAHPFRRSLSAIAVDAADRIYTLGDGEIRIFQSKGEIIRSWKAPDQALCFAVGPDEQVYFGMTGKLEIYSSSGTRSGGFTVGGESRAASVTAVKIYNKEILAADATARCIRRYDQSGKQLGVIGTQGKTRGFMLPNKSLDMDVDAQGVVRAADSGRHRVSSWILDGTPAGYFGKFGQTSPEDFVGCCNPVNLTIAQDGNVVTAEKVTTRVKVFDPNGRLLALIGPEHFDPRCTHLHLATDSKGRILVADPVRLVVKVFAATNKSGDHKSV